MINYVDLMAEVYVSKSQEGKRTPPYSKSETKQL